MIRALAIVVVWFGLQWVDAAIDGRGHLPTSLTSAPGARVDSATVGAVPGAVFFRGEE